ncbi:hypothetical protein IAD21_01582 [Abditibacteriota bacterium]|nr:hypothetical protein IAD21_01582 [Abditibacteriota bacterium]
MQEVISTVALTQPELKLTVYTIAYESASECKMVIQELRRQTMRADMEIIVVSPTREGMDESNFEEFGAWQWVIMPEVRACGEAMEAAVRVAQAPYVVYAEEHSYFDEEWAQRLVAAHERGYDAVGFAMENANPQTLTSWAQLYGQFGPLVAPVESRESHVLAGHHASYRKDVLLNYADLLSTMLEDESALFLDYHARGKRMFIAGDAISRHVNISNLKAYMHMDYLGQRSFASARARVGQWQWWKRALYVGATPLIPGVRLWRILRDIKRTGRQREMLPQILAPVALALLAGAWGEMLGYLAGSSDCAQRRAPAELQRERFLGKKDRWTKEQTVT